jgi:hypothetical protein
VEPVKAGGAKVVDISEPKCSVGLHVGKQGGACRSSHVDTPVGVSECSASKHSIAGSGSTERWQRKPIRAEHSMLQSASMLAASQGELRRFSLFHDKANDMRRSSSQNASEKRRECETESSGLLGCREDVCV